jgi:hypothetical protein
MKKFSSKQFKKRNELNLLNERNKSNNSPILIKQKELKKKILEKKEEIFIFDKSQKEILLNTIKNSQLYLLNQFSNTNNNEVIKEKNIYIIEFLRNLKSFLGYLLNEKIINQDYLQLDVNNKKIKIHNEMSKFFNYDCDKKINNNDSNKSTTNSDIGKESIEKNNVFNELFKLKLLNFIIENKIKEMEFEEKNLRRKLNYISKTYLFPEENREIYCYDNKDEINDKLNNIIQIEKNKYLNIINKDKQIKEKQELYLSEINKVKNNIVFKNNILEKNIIQELSIEDKITNNF